jgi:6-pyruvoyltetrahydropterin/6-carboxytetrahydropterin synthase
MYTVAVKRDFIAQHYLIGGDWGAENELHAHHYRVEARLQGERLDQHGYLVDIVDIESNLDALAAHYRDRTLNELSEFEGLNPSVERFAAILCRSLAARLKAANLAALTVKVWEGQDAWASYRYVLPLSPPSGGLQQA